MTGAKSRVKPAKMFMLRSRPSVSERRMESPASAGGGDGGGITGPGAVSNMGDCCARADTVSAAVNKWYNNEEVLILEVCRETKLKKSLLMAG